MQDTSGTSSAVVAVAICLGVGVPLTLLLLVLFGMLLHRMRLHAQSQERRRQQLSTFRGVLDTMQHLSRAGSLKAGLAQAAGMPLERVPELAFVITDLEASTAAAKANPTAYQQVQQSHDLVRRCIAVL